MRFTKPFWSGIGDGSTTLAFRAWKTPTVVVGRPYRTGGGRVEVLSINVVERVDAITEVQAKKSGHSSAEDLRAYLATSGSDRVVYRVEFKLLTEVDPREELANDDQLGPDDLAELDQRLDRLDRSAKHGPWTRETLRLIAERPETRAPDLAASVGRETQPFKLDVRKLKNLGLTISFNPGYRLSPRGRTYLSSLDAG